MRQYTTLDKYIISQFLSIALASVIFFSLTVVLIDLLTNLWKFLSEGAAAREVAMVSLFYFPKALWYSVPLGSLFACSLTLSSMYSQGEMKAIFASGVPLPRAAAGMAGISAICAPLLFVFDDAVVSPFYAKKVSLQRKLLHEERPLDSDKPVVLCDGGKIIYRAQYYNNEKKMLSGALFIFRDDNGKCLAIIKAKNALWDKKECAWHLSSAVQYTFQEGSISASSKIDEMLLRRLKEEPPAFQNTDMSVEEADAAHAAAYIKRLKKSGLPYNESLSLYYKKYSFPCVLFIVSLLATGLTGRTQKNASLMGLALSVSAAVMFYVVQMITMLMAKFGALPPLAGAWLPVIIFTALAFIAVATSKT